MKNRIFCLKGVALLALLLAICSRADAADKGAIAGNVLTPQGQPAVGLAIRLVQDMPLTADPGKKGNQGGPKIVARATTDAKGTFTMPDLAPGVYRLEGGSQQAGWIYEEVSVEAGKTTEKKDLKLVKTD